MSRSAGRRDRLAQPVEVEDDEAEAAARPAVLVGDRGGEPLAKRPPVVEAGNSWPGCSCRSRTRPGRSAAAGPGSWIGGLIAVIGVLVVVSLAAGASYESNL